MGTILIGTCGYSYNEWIGPVYPEGTKKEQYLSIYNTFFGTVELDYTYYKMPEAEQLRRILKAGTSAGPEMIFSIKATNTLTHKINSTQWPEEVKSYLKAIEPLREADRLGAVLFQFPNSFHYETENRRYLDKLLGAFAGIPSAVEFRNAEWGNNRVLEGLKARGAALVSTDEPDLKGLAPVLDVATSSLGYFRLHGRNAQNWWGSDSTARYDYLYNEQELEGIAERIKMIAGKAAKILVYFNNHARGQAVRNAKMLQQILNHEDRA